MGQQISSQPDIMTYETKTEGLNYYGHLNTVKKVLLAQQNKKLSGLSNSKSKKGYSGKFEPLKTTFFWVNFLNKT